VADLRRLQSREFLESLLTAIAAERNRLTPRRPLLLKISPDLTEPELDNALAALTAAGFDGIIAVNTTTRREGLPPAAAQRPGGLSGQPLTARATEVIRYLARRTEGKLPIIGVGGIGNAADALDKIRAGAWLTQIYTGMIYSGPGLAGEINRGLCRACQQAGVQRLAELRGQAP
jgi:dihydroorotate dehydrogenase